METKITTKVFDNKTFNNKIFYDTSFTSFHTLEFDFDSSKNYWMNYCSCVDDDFVKLIKDNKNLTEEEIYNNIVNDLGSEHKYLKAFMGLMLVYCKSHKGYDLSNFKQNKKYVKVKPEYRDNLIELARDCFNFMNVSKDENPKYYDSCAEYINVPKETYIYLIFSYMDSLGIFNHGTSIRCAYVNKNKSFDSYLEYF